MRNILKYKIFDVFILLLLTFLFNGKPTLFVMGGQDQGTYINMSALFTRQNSLVVRNTFRDTLNTEEKDLYDKHGKYVLPGFQQIGPDESVFLMKFYPLFPYTMSLFSSVINYFNISNNYIDLGVYLLSIYSLFSVLGIYFLTLEITKKRSMAILSSLLLIIQPAHVFFSKLPLTEMPSLAFNSFAFYFLLKSLRINEEYNKYSSIKHYIYLVLSLFLFTAFFYTRMSSFMYLPLILIILFLITLKYPKYFWSYFSYTVMWVCSFLLSYIFYKKYQYPLYDAILGKYVKTIFGANTLYAVIILGIDYLCLLFITYIYHKKEITKNISDFIGKYTVLLYPAICFLLTFNEKAQFNRLSRLDSESKRWYQVSDFIDTVSHLSFYQLINHISLFIFLIIIIGSIYLYLSSKENILGNSFSITTIIIISSYFTFVTIRYAGLYNYNYYQSRYFISEVIPYSIVLAVSLYSILNKNTLLKKVFTLLFIFSFSYYVFFSLIVRKVNEGADLSFYHNLINKIGDNSLLLVDKSYQAGSAVTAPMVWYYDLPVFIIDDEISKSPVLKTLIERNENVYLLSPSNISELTSNKPEKLRFKYNYLSNNPEYTIHSYSYLPIEYSKYYLPKDKIYSLLLPGGVFVGYIDQYLYTIK